MVPSYLALPDTFDFDRLLMPKVATGFFLRLAEKLLR
ncbi:hypothetical protein HMPREF1257_02247 [Corynebacterium sp. KPL1814]|nr:hypothetical protein HMPREF1281_02033 [Corynebacterium sp. KPL1855]ERS60059.1 hypothetical protein HMPREF1257_02247 [Corynebacterium sp. KPL1814]ERS77959.1 hypothetical protein HMPREF1285_01835 [Corynebacterium sp. KPL1859]